MKEQDFKKLASAFDTVFDDAGQIKACGRNACIDLITLMGKYSTEDVGDETTGNIKPENMKNEYLRILRAHIRG